MNFINKIFAFLFGLFDAQEYEVRSFGLSIDRISYLEFKYRSRLLDAGILHSKKRRALFWAQLTHESGLQPISENLNYSASGLLTTFSKYFNPVTALQYARQPERIARRVYANRMGNGSEATGDGWRYRGRGFIQTTGRDNYKELTALYLDTLSNPDLLMTEVAAMVAAIYYWTKHGINAYADKDDVNGATKVINGGLNGAADRQVKYNILITILT